MGVPGPRSIRNVTPLATVLVPASSCMSARKQPPFSGRDRASAGLPARAELGEVPENLVTFLQHVGIRSDRRRDAVDLVDPARRSLGRVTPDLVTYGPNENDWSS